ncbi:hypothetical protein OIO90_003488 [Microbotryomycetes sp. JL221]|nr:hypothetical protein OIO90_003488 [Microbotryomycetes sp. JL221]
MPKSRHARKSGTQDGPQEPNRGHRMEYIAFAVQMLQAMTVAVVLDTLTAQLRPILPALALDQTTFWLPSWLVSTLLMSWSTSTTRSTTTTLHSTCVHDARTVAWIIISVILGSLDQLYKLVYMRAWLMRQGLTLGPLIARVVPILLVTVPHLCLSTVSLNSSIRSCGEYLIWAAASFFATNLVNHRQHGFVSRSNVILIGSTLLVLLSVFLHAFGSTSCSRSTKCTRSKATQLLLCTALLALITACIVQTASNTTNSNVTILSSQQSTTGTIVTAETDSRGIKLRYLRADHSLLGGLWIGPAEKEVRERIKTHSMTKTDNEVERMALERAESIYSTFILQEAITLVKRQATARPRALVIGLGVGLVARAFEARQINTTIVEIDQVVYQHAHSYFRLQKPTGGVYIEDARLFLRRKPPLTEFDYVVHDVFTGGALPATLFTKECWQDVKAVLKPDGVVAINFAGDTTLVPARRIFATIMNVFKHCRAFEDGSHATRYRNIVLFCSANEIEFRQLDGRRDLIETVSPMLRQHTLSTFEEREYELDCNANDELVTDDNAVEVALLMASDPPQHVVDGMSVAAALVGKSKHLAHYHSGIREPTWPGSTGGWTLSCLSAFIIALVLSGVWIVGLLLIPTFSNFWINLGVWFPLFILSLISAIGIDVALDNNKTTRDGMFATVEAFIWLVTWTNFAYHLVFTFHAYKTRRSGDPA